MGIISYRTRPKTLSKSGYHNLKGISQKIGILCYWLLSYWVIDHSRRSTVQQFDSSTDNYALAFITCRYRALAFQRFDDTTANRFPILYLPTGFHIRPSNLNGHPHDFSPDRNFQESGHLMF